jgi:hypothetical protein
MKATDYLLNDNLHDRRDGRRVHGAILGVS